MFTNEELKDFTVIDIKNMFQREQAPMVPELAYLAFLIHSSWGVDFNIERGVERTLMQLRLPLYENQGISWEEKIINPEKIWATEDSLDKDKLDMVEAATRYMLRNEKPLPPVVVWLIKNSSRYNLVCHDGHHRIYIAYKLGIQIPAVVMEYWIDNREDPLLRKKLPYEKIDMYVPAMPVVKFKNLDRYLQDPIN